MSSTDLCNIEAEKMKEDHIVYFIMPALLANQIPTPITSSSKTYKTIHHYIFLKKIIILIIKLDSSLGFFFSQ